MKGRKHEVAAAAPDADRAVGALYEAHYQSLVRLAALAVGCDPGTAEEVVQDAFVAMHQRWRRIGGPDNALSYLRRSVLYPSRSALRHRADADARAPKPPLDAPGADHKAATRPGSPTVVVGALRGLPARQREALVLRYYADLSEASTAKVMGISKGAVKTHTARGMSALHALLKQQP
jgi:RNA polymerase sigma-70 factor (sigma-E family)